MKPFREWFLLQKVGLVFAFIFFTLVVNFGIIDYFEGQNKADSAIVDVAGRNRMLSQKIGFLAEMVVRGKTEAKRELKQVTDLHEASFQVLLHGGIPPQANVDTRFPVAPQELQACFTRIQKIWKGYKQATYQIINTNKPSEAVLAIGKIEQNRIAMLKANNDLVNAFVRFNENKQAQLTIILLVLMALNVCIMLFSLYMVRQIVVKPILHLSGIAAMMSKGNLGILDFHKGKDEIGKLGKALRKMTAVLRSTILDIQAVSKQISAAGSEMSRSSQQIADSANQGAQATDALHSHLETISNASDENVWRAEKTNVITQQAVQKVADSRHAFQETSMAMERIANESSIVQEIAAQTNILAINAAIEAARAGSAGKGFGVVAQAVRNLAEQSAGAAQKIEGLTNNGVSLARESEKILEEMLPQIQESSELISLISTASKTQNQRIQEVHTAMRKLAEISQQNATASEEMAASSEELSAQAQQLYDTTDFFKVRHKDSYYDDKKKQKKTTGDGV